MIRESEAFLDSLVSQSDRLTADVLDLQNHLAFAKRQPFAKLISGAAQEFHDGVMRADAAARRSPLEGRRETEQAFRDARVGLGRLRYYLTIAEGEGIARSKVVELMQTSSDLVMLLMAAEVCAKQGGIYVRERAG